ncbi:erg24, C-14 sterol reductase [Clydaea vesicula]|uniref:Erg24, C-14 sterol reductase n=1 Tax=Clydaea vesicula TaxID=447962 RepID=A0AAD5U6N2_9FUNG|nr:erg24, C-14 sterol reductase [Clydaea vesicula]
MFYFQLLETQNPRLPYSDSKLLDLKYFCELRPGMFLWAVLNYAYLAKQYLNGGLQNSMLFVCFGQLIYIVDSVWCESSILTTMDITTDGFGFMLTIGDLVWVPFTFSLQARYLSLFPNEISHLTLLSSNGQKNLFKTNPLHSSLKNLKYIKTESGSKLLITGWWGISRHINYFGDWLMGLSWCLATGFTTPLPYFYIFYFAALLIHRAQRDDVKCREKYGKDWEKYCSIVKYKIIPYVY